MARVSDLITYPLKSSKGIPHTTCDVTPLGLRYDRSWALFDIDGQVITGREQPKLLDLTCDVNEVGITVSLNQATVQATNSTTNQRAVDALKIFSYDAYGSHASAEADEWFSEYLGIPCRLYESNIKGGRVVLAKHGGDEEKDRVAFADQAPILILSEASMALLNSKLDTTVGMERFRPNIVISDCAPHEEDTWKLISIDDIQFRIIQPCERCVFVTIDNATKEKHPLGEPLRTLSTYRKGPRGGVILGMHAIPISEGQIRTGSAIKVLA